MRDEKRTATLSLERLYGGLAESCATLSDGEITADYEAAGESPGGVADEVRSLFKSTAKHYRQRELRAAAEAYQRIKGSLRARWTDLPTSADERRLLLTNVLAANPKVKSAFLSLQHRDYRKLSDGDVESLLMQLTELGLLGAEDGGEDHS